MTTDQLIVWVIVGLLAGSLTGMLLRRDRKGFGVWGNLLVGLVGAVIGGFLFDFFEIDLGLGNIQVTMEDLVSAFVGSLIFVVLIDLLGRRR